MRDQIVGLVRLDQGERAGVRRSPSDARGRRRAVRTRKPISAATALPYRAREADDRRKRRRPAARRGSRRPARTRARGRGWPRRSRRPPTHGVAFEPQQHLDEAARLGAGGDDEDAVSRAANAARSDPRLAAPGGLRRQRQQQREHRSPAGNRTHLDPVIQQVGETLWRHTGRGRFPARARRARPRDLVVFGEDAVDILAPGCRDRCPRPRGGGRRPRRRQPTSTRPLRV